MSEATNKKVSNKELAELWVKVDSEGFGYYMMHYGPDMDLIERLGFDKSEVQAAIDLFEKIEEKINEGEEFAEEC